MGTFRYLAGRSPAMPTGAAWAGFALVGLALFGLAVWASAGAARADGPLSTQDRVALQSTMAQYIDQHMIGDAFIHVDPRTGDVEKLYPVTQHPMIVRLNNVVVLCSDLKTASGKLVNADFYATRDNGQFVIFQTEIGNREPLQALLLKGAASLLE
jgi:hypothetical protein